MTRVSLVAALVILTFAVATQAQDKTKTVEAKSIALSEKEASEVKPLYSEFIVAQSGFEYVKSQIVDDSNCAKQFLSNFQKDVEMKFGRYRNRLLELRLSLAIPNEWGFSIERMAFERPPLK
jgi:hypothetical protein